MSAAPFGACSRRDVRIAVPGAELAAWWYLPPGGGPHPAIAMCHGFGAVKEMFLHRFAQLFCEAGFAVVVFDHRGFGDSSGEPRQESDPLLQQRDLRDVITWLRAQSEVDAARIGLWGTSYSGGHVLQVAAADRRVACVVAQVPSISGYEQTRRRVHPSRMQGTHALYADERDRLAAGQPPRLRPLVPLAAGEAAVYDAPEAVAFYRQGLTLSRTWRNEVTLMTLAYSTEYEPGEHIERISPTPLLMIVAADDTVTPTDLALQAYERALHPKRLVLLPGGHFTPYEREFERASGAALEWLRLHLRPGNEATAAWVA